MKKLRLELDHKITCKKCLKHPTHSTFDLYRQTLAGLDTTLKDMIVRLIEESSIIHHLIYMRFLIILLMLNKERRQRIKREFNEISKPDV